MTRHVVRALLLVVAGLDAGAVCAQAAQGAPFSPQLAGQQPGTFLADPFQVLRPNGQREMIFRGPEVYHFIHHYNSPGTFLSSDNYAATWNRGSQPNGRFDTVGHNLLHLDSMSHASGIEQVITATTVHANLGDHAFMYVYNNYMPGGAVAGSDEGYAGIRLGSYPLHSMDTVLNSNAENVTGSEHLHWDKAGFCGGSGSNFSSDSCTAAGYWMGDMNDPIYPGLHMDAFQHTSTTLPTQVHVKEALRPGIFVSSGAKIEPCGNVQAGCTVTLAVELPRGFVDPKSGHACISSQAEHTAEEVGYTLSSHQITLTKQRFIHYPRGGVITIGLQSCAVAYFAQDAEDNAASYTTGAGPTYYIVMGALNAHTLLLVSHRGGSRDDGSIGQQSIRPDGGKLGLLGVYPGALVIDVNDPTFKPNVDSAYALNVRYAHLGTNSAPWGPGKRILEGYFSADIYYLHRDICDNNLADLGMGRDCNYVEGRGNLANFNHWRSTQDPATRGRRDTPNVNFFEFYSNNNKAGFYGVYDLATGTPDYGWLVSDRSGCGGHLDDPQACPDHFLWKEGGSKWIKVSDATQRMTFSMPIVFTAPVSLKSDLRSERLKGEGNAYACLDSEGKLFRSDKPCR